MAHDEHGLSFLQVPLRCVEGRLARTMMMSISSTKTQLSSSLDYCSSVTLTTSFPLCSGLP